jgi:hypothetical protein
MDLANMRRQGVRRLIAYCLNDSCRHQALIDVSNYPGDTPVPWYRSKVKCGKCGARGNRIDVRPNCGSLTRSAPQHRNPTFEAIS